MRLSSKGVTGDESEEAMRLLSSSKLYGFCKSHAMSYAHLAWALAYEKAHNLKSFWEQFIDKVRLLLGFGGAAPGRLFAHRNAMERLLIIIINSIDRGMSAGRGGITNPLVGNPKPETPNPKP